MWFLAGYYQLVSQLGFEDVMFGRFQEEITAEVAADGLHCNVPATKASKMLEDVTCYRSGPLSSLI